MNQIEANSLGHFETPKVLRRHPLNLLLPAVWSFLMLFPTVFAYIFMNTADIFENPLAVLGFWLFTGLHVVFVLNFFMTHWVLWYMDAWLITRDRLIDIELVSLFNRRMSQIAFNQIQDVRVDVSGYLGNLLNYGNIRVQSAGRDTFFELTAIPKPYRVAQEISNLSQFNHHHHHQPNNHDQDNILTAQAGHVIESNNRVQLANYDAPVVAENSQLQNLLDPHHEDRNEIMNDIADQYRTPSVNLEGYEIPAEVIGLVPGEIAKKYDLVPISFSPDRVLSLALAHPSPEIITDLIHQFEVPLTFFHGDEQHIREAIEKYYE